MANQEDFTGTPLVAGSVRGMRFFGTTIGMRLTSMYAPDYIWQEGENLAKCSELMRILLLRSPFNPNPTLPPPHPSGTLSCSCGFYAFNNQPLMDIIRTDEAERAQVGAIVEGYGRVVVGSKGFRAEKAKILALFFPSWKADYIRGLEYLLNAQYPNLPILIDQYEALEKFPVEGVKDRPLSDIEVSRFLLARAESHNG